MYQTKRLTLLTAQEIKADAVLKYYEINQKHLSRWEPVREDSFYTVEYQNEVLKKDLATFNDRTGLKLYITLDGQEVIGILNFFNIIYGCFLSTFVGYGLGEKYVGNGYMTEALTKGIDIMFNEYGLHRIEGNVIPENTDSMAVLQRCGFESEGLSRNYLRINGIWKDHIHMVILNKTMA